MKSLKIKGYLFVFGSAILFSLSTPLNKLLILDIEPMVISGYIYLFSGLFFFPSFWLDKKKEPIKKVDLRIIMPMILFGAVCAPLALLYGLDQISSFQASLYLNFELVFTISLAFFIFHEKIGRNGILGLTIIVFVLIGWSIDFKLSLLLSLDFSTGALLVILACFFWGLDNNLAQKLGEKSSFQITTIKGIIGGIFTLLLSLGNDFSLSITFDKIFALLFVGVCSYGLSIVLFISSLKYIGTAKAGIIFSLSPFFSGIFSLIIDFIVLREISFSYMDGFLYLIVFIGIILILKDHHDHNHFHPRFIHIHPLENDLHHQESLISIIEDRGNNVIIHEHRELVHTHDHLHDIHHHHKHGHNQG